MAPVTSKTRSDTAALFSAALSLATFATAEEGPTSTRARIHGPVNARSLRDHAGDRQAIACTSIISIPLDRKNTKENPCG
jgi:hypothetical protein